MGNNQHHLMKRPILIILFSLNLIFSLIIIGTSNVCANQEITSFVQNSDTEYPRFQTNNKIIKMDNKFIVPSNSSMVITNPPTEITLPIGTDVISYNNKEVEIVHEDFEIEKINLTESTKLFLPFNYGILITGTQNFTFKIYFNENYSDIKYDEYITNYSIYWGDTKITNGSYEFPDVLIHNYKKPGCYNITIEFIDENGVQYSYEDDYTFNLSTGQFITFWTIENKEPLTIGTSGVIGIFICFGIAFTETGRYRILAFLTMAFPMITNSDTEDVLDQFVRGQIYGYIKTNPGTHYNQLMRELDIKNGTLSYHLYVLEKSGIIKSRIEQFRYRAFYPTDMKFPEEERYRLTNLQIRILETIQSNKGVSQKFIAKTLNEAHQTISYNIKILEQASLIYIYKKGRKNQIYISKDNVSFKPVTNSEKSYSINLK